MNNDPDFPSDVGATQSILERHSNRTPGRPDSTGKCFNGEEIDLYFFKVKNSTMAQKTKITKKKVEIEISFIGNGSIIEKRKNVFSRGIVEPTIGDNLNFVVREDFPDEEGVLNPNLEDDTYQGAFSINVWGNSEGYRELAKYLLAVAELDTGTDPSFHEHHHVVSSDGRTQFHIIVRKPKIEV
jgi:hypothetical protein